jgi:response regulator RpfG family c-di-GMP phosphodiesterase
VLVVDDDQDIHILTKLVLRGYEFEGKCLNLISAFSGVEARKMLEEHDDIALILLDVVMEDHNTGLELTKYIREELHNNMVRIILRTGQPGWAPEKDVVMQYDINDYKTKTELTSGKLHTAITSSLRSYRDLITIERNRTGLKKIIDATSCLFKQQSLQNLASGILTQLTAILRMDESSLYARAACLAATKDKEEFYIIAATGQYEEGIGKPVRDYISSELYDEFSKTAEKRMCVFLEDSYIGFFRNDDKSETIIYLKTRRNLTPLDQELISIFTGNASIAFDNFYHYTGELEAQKEIIIRLTEWGESLKGEELTNHTRRVGKICRILASEYGLNDYDPDILEMTAILHDLGKFRLPAQLLDKPKKLDKEEIEMVKSHPDKGSQLLEGSDSVILQSAALSIRQHHEKWEGSGYPRGLKGEEIDKFSRVVALADVFDSMTHRRSWREAISVEETVNYITEQKGKHFAPELVDIFLKNLDSIVKIFEQFPDE